MKSARWLGLSLLCLAACKGAPPEPTADGSGAPAAAAHKPAGPIDPRAVESSTGIKPEVEDGVAKVTYWRTDVKVEVDGFALPPFMGLTSWAAFSPGKAPGAEAMVMGDLALFEDEVTDVMDALLDAGIKITALHNHFSFEKPRVYFMHIEGEGPLKTLGKAVRKALDAMKGVRAHAPEPATSFGDGPIPTPSTIDPAKVEAALGHKGAAKDGMVKVTVGHAATQAAGGAKLGRLMGVSTWAAFAGTDDITVVDGDFAVTEDELQPVRKALRAGGIHVVAIHNHMVGEQPRILFLHYWGRGSVASLGATLKGALALTKTEP
jgi:hypothetical protein